MQNIWNMTEIISLKQQNQKLTGVTLINVSRENA